MSRKLGISNRSLDKADCNRTRDLWIGVNG